ncbi:unnamed protein product [Parajaminaea phylloscopi]
MASTSRQPAYGLAKALAQDVPSPPVAQAAAWAKLYPGPASPVRSQPPVYINLAQGVPSNLPSREMRDRMAQEAAKDAHHGYSAPSGRLLDALSSRMNAVYRDGRSHGAGAVTPRDICLTAGCNMASEFAFRTIANVNANEAIVLPTPFYFNHSMQLLGLSIEPVPLPCAPPAYLPSVQDFVALLAKHAQDPTLPRIKGITIVSPNNPTGAILPASLVSQFARVCKAEGIALILDETYRDFLVDEQGRQIKPHDLFEDSIADEAQWEWRDTVISLYSFSKAFAIPGHRLGAMVAHPSLISYLTQAKPSTAGDDSVQQWTEFGPLSKALDNTLICAPRLDVQEAVAWALEDPAEQEWRNQVALALRRRAQRLRAAFEREMRGAAQDPADASGDAATGWEIESVGGYYAFVTHPFADVSSTAVAKGLAVLVGLGVLPGDYFVPAASAAATEDPRQTGNGKYQWAERDEAVGSRRIRLSLANVKDEELLDEVPKRMMLLTRLWAEKGQGWGIA